MKTSLIRNGQIVNPISIESLEVSNELIAREWDEKQARLKKQRDENRKRLFPTLWAKEQEAKQS